MKALSAMGDFGRIENKIRLRDDSWIADCYSELRRPFVRWIRRQFLIDAETALELFQSSLVTIYENIVSGKLTSLTSSLKTYLFAIGKNKAYEFIKQRGRRESLDVMNFTLAFELDPEDSDDRQPEVEFVIRTIGEPCYSLFRLFYFENRSWAEIAVELKYTNDHSARSMKYKCIQKAQEMIHLKRHLNKT